MKGPDRWVPHVRKREKTVRCGEADGWGHAVSEGRGAHGAGWALAGLRAHRV